MGKGGSVSADDERVQAICDAIRVIPDFPKARLPPFAAAACCCLRALEVVQPWLPC